jgi:hypothetical protein
LSFVEKRAAAICELRYEDLVVRPEEGIRRVTDFLELPPLASVALPEKDSLKEAKLGDKTGIHKFKGVSATPTEEWKNSFASPLRRFWAKRYLEFLGAKSLKKMGYSTEELLATIHSAGTSPPQLANDLRTLRWRIFRAFERPPFYRTKMKTRDSRRGLG